MRRSTVLLCALAVGACNADTFEPVDGGSDAAPNDASPDVPSVGGDGGTVEGGAVDAPPPLAFCETVSDAKFCADFDDPDDAGAGFLSPAAVDTGFSLTYQSQRAHSDPTAVRMDVPASSSGQAQLSVGLGTTATTGASTTAKLDLALYITALLPGPYSPIDLFDFGAVTPDFQFALSLATQWELRNVTTNKLVPVTGEVPTNEWVHVTLTVTLDATAGSATLAVTSSKGTAVATLAPVATIPSMTPTYPILLSIGPNATGALGQTPSFFYDDVVVHYQ